MGRIRICTKSAYVFSPGGCKEIIIRILTKQG
jgi:hypothetical protein